MEAKGEMMKSVLRWCVVPLLASTLVAQTAAKPKSKKPVARPRAVTAADVQALKDALAAQQQQIEQLRQAMQSRDAALQHPHSHPTRRAPPSTHAIRLGAVTAGVAGVAANL